MPTQFNRIKKYALFYALLFFSGISSFAQTSKIDDLLRQLKSSDADTSKIKILRKLSAAYTSVDPVKKYDYANQFRLLGEKNKIDSVVSAAYIDMGVSYGVRSNLDSALYYFNLGYQKAKESNYIIGIARSLGNIGFAYDRQDRKRDAVKHYEESLRIYKKLNIRKSINQNITNLGSIYFDLGEYKTAQNYFQQVLESVKQTPDDKMGLAAALFSLGNTSRKLGKQDKALDYFKRSLAIRENIGDINGIALSNWGIGLALFNKKKYRQALPYFDVALKNNRKLKDIYQEGVVLMAIGDTYLQLKDLKKAEEYSKLGLERARESGSKGLIAQGLEQIVTVTKAQQKFAEALLYQTDYIAVNDSIDKSSTTKEVILNDLRRINTDNKNLESRNKKISAKIADYVVTISVITMLLLVVAVLLVLYYKKNLEKKTANALLQKQKKEIAEANEELTAQMEIIYNQNAELEKLNKVKNKFFSIVSHDLRGPLNSLKMLFGAYREGGLNEQELGQLLMRLEDTIYQTASFLDNLLEWSKSQLEGMVVKATEIELVTIAQNNIKLMDSQIRQKQLHVENNIGSDIAVLADPNMINVVIRNLLSNAIKFCSPGDNITFSASLEGENVVCTISDTGRGISEVDQANLFNLSHTISTGTAGEKGHHIGLILCKDMIDQNNGNLRVSSTLGQGTTFYVTLPAYVFEKV
jgi:signal transduction histidine kinase